MSSNIPDPSAYGISPKYGFLSSQAPLTNFKDTYYRPWDDVIPNLADLNTNGTIDNEIAKLPLLSTDKLEGGVEYRRAYVILAFLIHSHVWHAPATSPGSHPNELVPPQLTEPFLEVCSYLRMHPVVSYAGLCSWNWQLQNGGGMELESMATIASFTGTEGEATFYHVPVLVEYGGGHLVHLLLGALEAALSSDKNNTKSNQLVREALQETTRSLIRMGDQLKKFYGKLEAHSFYHKHRPYMAGGKGMEDRGLPRGMVFQRSNGEEVEMKLVGGSAAQSSLFPFLDYVLGVKHEDETVFKEMRDYMPGVHRDFLDEVSKLPSLREYVAKQPRDTELQGAYNTCMETLRSWRGKHIAAVSKYIVQPAREAERAAKVEKIEENAEGAEGEKEWELQGTGGSALIPFLRQSKDDTVGIEVHG